MWFSTLNLPFAGAVLSVSLDKPRDVTHQNLVIIEQIVSDTLLEGDHPRISTFHMLIFSSETTWPIATKLWWNGPWVDPFQLCEI
jgi:hypothetical protein